MESQHYHFLSGKLLNFSVPKCLEGVNSASEVCCEVPQVNRYEVLRASKHLIRISPYCYHHHHHYPYTHVKYIVDNQC